MLKLTLIVSSMLLAPISPDEEDFRFEAFFCLSLFFCFPFPPLTKVGVVGTQIEDGVGDAEAPKPGFGWTDEAVAVVEEDVIDAAVEEDAAAEVGTVVVVVVVVEGAMAPSDVEIDIVGSEEGVIRFETS